MKLIKAKTLTLITLIVLCLQFFFCTQFFEPYPALIMPGFSGVPDNSGQAASAHYTVTAFAGQDSFDLPVETMFPYQWPWHAYRTVDRLIHYERKWQQKTLSVGQLSWSVAIDRRLPVSDSLLFLNYLKDTWRHYTPDAAPLDSIRFSYTQRAYGTIIDCQWKTFELD